MGVSIVQYGCLYKDTIIGEKQMTQVEILEELRKLSPADRLSIIEAVLHLTRQDLQYLEPSVEKAKRDRQLVEAAQALLPDYLEDGELTAFTILDGEDIRE
jgi:hypothetical protein